MKKITQYRSAPGILQSSNYRYGDLYGMSYLPYFKKELWKNTTDIVLDSCNTPRLINLYCIGDSYLYLFMPSDTIFCGVNKFIFKRWDPGVPIETDLDTNQINVLLIERTERQLRWISLPDYLDKIKFAKKNGTAGKEVRNKNMQYASMGFFNNEKVIELWDGIFNKNINQNLEFNLFDYPIFNPFKELKAKLNYELFGRTDKNVALIPDQPYLFFRRTVDPDSANSSFMPIDDEQVNQIVETLDSTYIYYRANGFDAVCLSIIPNPVSIICPGYKTYNNIIMRVQNHSDLMMPIINIFDSLKTARCQVYSNCDSHWNYNGFNLWINEVNKYLRKVDKVKINPYLGRSINTFPPYFFDKIYDSILAGLLRTNSITRQCDGSIDLINGMLVQPGIITNGSLSVEGWLAVSAKDGVVPDYIILTLKKTGQPARYIVTKRKEREDVKLGFNQPKLINVGFTANIDVSSLSGEYELGLASGYHGNFQECSQFKIPIKIMEYKAKE